MKFFSYAMAYAVIVLVIYLVIKLFRCAFVRIKAYIMRRKLANVAEPDKKPDTEKKDG